MFSFLRKKSLVKRAALAGAVLVLLASFLFVSCEQPGNITNVQSPTINVQPQGNIWDVETEDEFELTVEASVTDGGTLSYQWYSNATESKSVGTEINQAISETLTLKSDDYNTENGDYYFYVVVTNTKDGEKASVTSDVAVVTVDGVGGVYLNAQKPVIETHPANTFWNVFTAASGVKLTVEAKVTDGGDLSYQWYSNTSANAVNGTKIDTATDKDYTLTKTAYTANGTYYFYVIITNTNNDVTGTKIVHETSNVATVTVVGYPDTGYSDTHTLPSKLTGEWKSEYGEIYTISAGEFSSGMEWEGEWSGYKGTIVNHRGNAEGTTGYITIQFTECTWDEDAENKYYVVYYKNLTDTTVTISGAGLLADPDFGNSGGRATKDEAEATYTVSSGYFATGSDLTKEEEGGTPLVNAATPTITGQPVNTYWDVSIDTTKTLTVTANVNDGGQLSYQWYKKSKADDASGTPLAGKTDATLTLTAAEYPGKTSYYRFFYCEVTNTLGSTTATATSDTARVIVTGHTFVLEDRWIGTWEPDNNAGDYFWIAADGSAEYDIFSMGMIPSGFPFWGWTGKIYDIVYWDEDEEEGMIFQKYDPPDGSNGWQTTGSGDYTGFYFKQVSPGWYLMLNLADPAFGDSGQYAQPMYTTPELAIKALTPENVNPQLIVMITYTKTP
jgi:hypothetical protein